MTEQGIKGKTSERVCFTWLQVRLKRHLLAFNELESPVAAPSDAAAAARDSRLYWSDGEDVMEGEGGREIRSDEESRDHEEQEDQHQD